VAKLPEWVNRYAHDKKAIESAATKQLTELNILSESKVAVAIHPLILKVNRPAKRGD
jgi:hypothetical protein